MPPLDSEPPASLRTEIVAGVTTFFTIAYIVIVNPAILSTEGTIVLQGGVPWPIALGIVFWSGVLFLLVSTTPLREAIALAIPQSLRRATGAGIGLLTFIGLQNAGLVAANPATMVGVGPLDHRVADDDGRRDYRVAGAPRQPVRLSGRGRRHNGGRVDWRLG